MQKFVDNSLNINSPIDYERIELLLFNELLNGIDEFSQTHLNTNVYSIALVFGDLIKNRYLNLKIGTQEFLKNILSSYRYEIEKYHPSNLSGFKKLIGSEELNCLIAKHSSLLLKIEDDNYSSLPDELNDLYAYHYRTFNNTIFSVISKISKYLSKIDKTDDFIVFYVPYEDIALDDLERFIEKAKSIA